MCDHPTFEEATVFFSEIYYGEHHIPSDIKPFGSGWAINHRGDVATHDFNMLTRMVFLAHDMCYRLQIQQGAPGSIKIVIWKRRARTGDISYRHPTIEQALTKWRETHKNEEARQDIIEADKSAQQLKPKMPLLEEVYRSVQCGPYNDLSYRERHVLEASYEFISRHFGR